MYDKQKVISLALLEEGYLEKSKAAYLKNPGVLDHKTDGAGNDNYTKYGRDMHQIYPAVMDFPAAWCDCFVDWCFQRAYGVSNAKGLLGGNFDDYTVGSAQLYINKKAYIRRGEGMPQPGDQIFFNNGTRICHTGLVYKVENQRVYTIEGNTSGGSTLVSNGGGVARKSYPLDYPKIDGYGRPNYAGTSQKADVKGVCYPRYTGTSKVFLEALRAVGCTDTSKAYRKKLAVKNGIVKSEDEYAGTSEQNNELFKMLRNGILKKA